MQGEEEQSRGLAVPPGAISALLLELAKVPEGPEKAPAAPFRAGQVVGRFELLREIGRGGFGIVYEARDRELGRAVAFKAVLAGGKLDLKEERLLREAEAAARLSHPNIVTLFDVGHCEQGPYLLLELLRGISLAARLKEGALAVREALRIAREVAKGVAHAHAQGVVHRDLTPGNVFLCDDGQVKVLDFGLAHAFGRRKVAGGTKVYMAPEQARGAPEDERTDVFALGVILYEMLTGQCPFHGDVASPEDPAPAPELDPGTEAGLAELVSRMLEGDPVKRLRDAAEVLAALTALELRWDRVPAEHWPAASVRAWRWLRASRRDDFSGRRGPQAQPKRIPMGRDATEGARRDLRPPARVVPQPPPILVGRERELSELHACFDRAASGERQIVFISGEPGIGKTTVIEAFLAGAASEEILIGQGHCIEHYGAGEAYLPILEALTRLCREPGGQRIVQVLRQHAPTWLVQMPSVTTDVELQVLQRRTAGVTRDPMLRELTEAVEVMAAEAPLTIWLEDLHWSDVSTVDWLAYVARRPGPARLLVLGSYRPSEVPGHPLGAVKDDLEVHGRCRELALSLLDPSAVGQYLRRRFPPAAEHEPAFAELARIIHQRTEGNPLFVANVVEDLLAGGVLVERDEQWEVVQDPEAVRVTIPDDVRRMIGHQLDRVLPESRRVLEAASIAGAEFSSAAVAAAAEVAIDEAEASCADLARRGSFLASRGSDNWPDGTIAGRYGFRHALHQEVVYERVSARRCAELHRRIGERLETAFGEGAGAVAAELAMHFERGRSIEQAIRYLHQAGEVAARRSAVREAVAHLTKALALLKALPDTAGRARHEVALQIALGTPLMAIRGWGAPEVERTYARAQELCERLGDPPQLFKALYGLWQFRVERAELGLARELGERLLALAQRTDDMGVRLEAHHALWTSLFSQGELIAARDHVARGIALYDPDRHGSLALVYGHHDPGVCSRSIGAWALELLGESDLATRYSHDALALARKLGYPFSEALALVYAAVLHRLRGDWQTTRRLAEEACAIAREQGFVVPLGRATIMRGWAMAQAGDSENGIAQMREGIAVVRSLCPLFLSYNLGSLAEGYAKANRVDAALDAVTEALATVERTGERFYEAELRRLYGELLLLNRGELDAERSFRTALEIARRQRALTLERRALRSLCQLLERQGRSDEARSLAATGDSTGGEGAIRGVDGETQGRGG